jgi:hypothetical protein
MSFDGLVAAGVVSRHRASADLDDPHASKQGFDTEKQGDGTENTEKSGFWRFARSSTRCRHAGVGTRWRSKRRAERHVCLLCALHRSPGFLCVETLLACRGSIPAPAPPDYSRPTLLYRSQHDWRMARVAPPNMAGPKSPGRCPGDRPAISCLPAVAGTSPTMTAELAMTVERHRLYAMSHDGAETDISPDSQQYRRTPGTSFGALAR